MGDLASAAFSGGANIVGGVLGYAAQRSANKTNLQIARETSAYNQAINESNLSWQREALRSQQNYASFANQIKMAKDAGVNPYLAIGSPAQGGAAGTPVSHAMQAARVEPENALGTAIGRTGSDMANVMALVAQANKDTQEAKGHEIDNITKGAVNKAQLESLGKTVEAQTIQNRLSTDTYDAMVHNADLINQKLEKENQLYDIEKDIKIFTRDKIQPQELAKIIEEIKLIQEQGLTQQSQRALNDAMGRAHLTQAAASMILARVEQFKAPSQVQLNKAMAENQQTQAAVNRVAERLKKSEAFVYDKFGYAIAEAQKRGLDAEALQKEENLKNIWLEQQHLHKDLSWTDFKTIMSSLIPVSVLGGLFSKFGSSPAPVTGFR